MMSNPTRPRSRHEQRTVLDDVSLTLAPGAITALVGVTEQGSHEELLDRDGQYARMWASYTAGQTKEWQVPK